MHETSGLTCRETLQGLREVQGLGKGVGAKLPGVSVHGLHGFDLGHRHGELELPRLHRVRRQAGPGLGLLSRRTDPARQLPRGHQGSLLFLPWRCEIKIQGSAVAVVGILFGEDPIRFRSVFNPTISLSPPLEESTSSGACLLIPFHVAHLAGLEEALSKNSDLARDYIFAERTPEYSAVAAMFMEAMKPQWQFLLTFCQDSEDQDYFGAWKR